MYMLMFGGRHPFFIGSLQLDLHSLIAGKLDFRVAATNAFLRRLSGEGILRFSDAARRLCSAMVQPNAGQRITAQAALQDPWLTSAGVTRAAASRAASPVRRMCAPIMQPSGDKLVPLLTDRSPAGNMVSGSPAVLSHVLSQQISPRTPAAPSHVLSHVDDSSGYGTPSPILDKRVGVDQAVVFNGFAQAVLDNFAQSTQKENATIGNGVMKSASPQSPPHPRKNFQFQLQPSPALGAVPLTVLPRHPLVPPAVRLQRQPGSNDTVLLDALSRSLEVLPSRSSSAQQLASDNGVWRSASPQCGPVTAAMRNAWGSWPQHRDASAVQRGTVSPSPAFRPPGSHSAVPVQVGRVVERSLSPAFRTTSSQSVSILSGTTTPCAAPMLLSGTTTPAASPALVTRNTNTWSDSYTCPPRRPSSPRRHSASTASMPASTPR